ncbi:MAG: MBL fold metallo-hydrolase [Solirubrobacteraceae bacterium]|nr:MBL fold metallo-hydrolase [Solirubrobacteraceae bacterium]
MSTLPTEPLAVEDVAPGVTRIALPVPSLEHGVNVHVVRGDGPTTLVDTGIPLPGTLDLLAGALAGIGVPLADVEQVLLTHHHFDHLGLASSIAARSAARIVGLPELDRVLSDPAGHFRVELDWGERHAARHGAPDRLLSGTRRALPLMATLPPGRVDVPVDDGDVVRAGDLDLVVHRRPGHSPTDTVFVAAGAGPAFVGDHLFVGAPITPVLGSMVADDGRPAAAYLEGLDRTAAEARLLLPGHGPAIADPVALLTERRAALDRKVDRAHAALGDDPVTAWELGGRVWPGRISMTHGLTRLAALLASLELLEARGRVARRVDPDGVVRWARDDG